jgi:hypothetical protein
MSQRKTTEFIVRFEESELTDEQRRRIDDAIRSAVARSIVELGLPQVVRPLPQGSLGSGGGVLSGAVAVDPSV